MKKIILTVAVICSALFVACSSDDNGDDNSQVCETCTIEAEGITVETEYCDNEDGTVTATTQGQEQIIELNGISFEDFIEGIELLGDCQSS